MSRETDEGADEHDITRRDALQAAAAMGALGAAGCLGGGGGGGGSENLQVTGWAADDTEADLLQELIDDYEEENDVTVEYDPIPSEYQRQIQTRIGSGEIADVFYLDASYFASFADEGVLLDLEEHVEDDDDFDVDDFFDPLIEAFTYDGTLYGIPKDFSTLQLYYNQRMLENAGVSEVPSTWSDLRSTLEAIQEEGEVDYPMMEFDNARIFESFLYQNGGQVMTDDYSECVVASDQNVETLEFIVGLVEDDLIGRPSEVGADWHGGAIGEEMVAMAAIGPWALPALESDFPDVDENIDVAHLPTPEGGEQATAAYTVSYSSSTHTEIPDEAYSLISYLTDDEGMSAWAEQGLALSARKSHSDLEYYDEHPRRRTHLEAGDWSHVIAFGPNSQEIVNELRPQLEGVMTGEREPREALESVQETVNNEIL